MERGGGGEGGREEEKYVGIYTKLIVAPGYLINLVLWPPRKRSLSKWFICVKYMYEVKVL